MDDDPADDDPADVSPASSAPTHAGAPPLAAAPDWLAARCPSPDGPLTRVAGAIAAGAVDGHDGDAVTRALRVAGSAYRDPRVWMMTSLTLDPTVSAPLLTRAMGRPSTPARRRCGIGYLRTHAAERAVVVVVDTLADPEPIPLRARTGTWVRLGGRVFGPAGVAKFVVVGPTRLPKTLPTSSSGDRASAAVVVDEPGTWLVQLLVDAGDGPSPVLDAALFVDCEPNEAPWSEAAPGEEAAEATDAPAAGLAEVITRMIDGARAAHQLAPLPRDPRLDQVAEQHARAMSRTRKLAHDVGRGDPVERLARAGVRASDIGENLAHAQSAALAHRALWYSPSHRLNLLGEHFARMGVGAAADADGSIWIAELFER